jgi:hypothetical protein
MWNPFSPIETLFLIRLGHGKPPKNVAEKEVLYAGN